ncbi:hypothetical protein ABB37_05573 [Leptomonas pyrrhocoris]|uniref:Uncharacterized protein n=1 Tax=Leptomonas pyrrhocoris TaxID=157538 RepID=A0A0M9FZD9_LEPPY|nr:hypothetical protein ABB37_05573 [Leptomonas pyrrhocoris]KPA79037.1 hypothetical protein ABB37_05573 [Leptomonas pyrrhocoris]|eukprot:XP_015657476.1 hypothetical protein ABB37_05573 [Leptomonas pyrrhocoris]
MPARVSPFRDLCDAAAALYESADNATTAHRGAQSRRLARLMDRFRHIPADGGPAGVRWSAATGLPLSSAATRRGGEGKEEDGKVEVKAHFVTISTRMDDFAQATTTAATMAGVRLNVIGVGWNWFAFTRRMELLRSFIDQDNVDEDDVLVSVDADAVFSGEDLYDSLAAFVASTAANATEHETYRVRDIRLGRRQPPVLFSAEYNCMHAQAYPSRHLCPTGYNVIDQMMSTWSQQAGVPLPSAHRRVNPFPYLNAGVVVARVWAIRRVWAASQAFMSSHTFYEGDEWWCDQSVLGSLYLQLRWWEIKSFALDAAPAQLLSTATQAECLFPPLMLPEPHRGPHGLPGGLIGLDDAGRFSLVISTQMDQKGVFQVGGTPITQSTQPEDALATYLRSGGRVEDGLTGVPRSGHRVELVPRAGFDCGGAAGHNAQAIRPPECAYRAAVLGVPGSAEAVTPLIWHFAGKYKRPLLTRFRVVFPWYTPMLWNASVRLAVLATVTAAPPTRLWYLNATTDLPFANIVHALYSHSSEDDASFEQMCELSRVRAGRTSLKNG